MRMKKKSVTFLLKSWSRRGLRQKREVLVTVDAEDLARVDEYPWFLKYKYGKLDYIYTTVSRSGRIHVMKLGRFIYGENKIPYRLDVGYVDGNPANNKKNNLALFSTYNRQRVDFTRRGE